MKRIYAFTLEGEDCLSSKFRNNLRLIASLLYEYIYNYDGDGFTPLIINESIKFNPIYSANGRNEYYLKYDKYSEKYINYEPFLIGECSFALTIDDEVISEDIMHELMNQALFEVSLLEKINYAYTVRTVSYFSKDKEDEKNRRKAVHELCDGINGVKERNNGFTRKKVMNSFPFKSRVGLF